MLPRAHATIIQSTTPLTSTLNKLHHVCYANWWMPRWVAQLVLLSTAWQVDRDAKIWNTKCFRPQPILNRDEQPLREYRRWFKQFYHNEELF